MCWDPLFNRASCDKALYSTCVVPLTIRLISVPRFSIILDTSGISWKPIWAHMLDCLVDQHSELLHLGLFSFFPDFDMCFS